MEYILVESIDTFNDFQGAKLNYSKQKCSDGISFTPSGLLNETGIWNGNLDKVKIESVDCLSFNGNKDLVASVFYVLTRMEEYNCYSYDDHDRFPFSHSILKKYEWVEQAVCDRWASYIMVDLLKVEVVKSKVEIIPTFDIDNTYAFKLKSGKRRALSKLKDVVKLDAKRITKRKSVENGEKDPYDTFDKIIEVGKQFSGVKVFWLTASEGSKDRNVPIGNIQHRKLIKRVAQSVEVNIHPSYGSFLNASQVMSERDGLESITGSSIVRSRQHFLRFQLPKSYRDLIDAGIRNDYSMGFAENVGFRSGTARAHNWFDLERNEVTELTLHPFTYMDGTLLEYMSLTPEESKRRIQKLYAEIQNFGGDFIFLWHNETIGEYGKWKGWSQVLDFTLNLKNE
ncbi:polysaccharide deacetylase family protein [Crocinitomicaceae bacterium]|nr:polysaccharide deacetylase family protein [Crocinitomicaceae bacterium]